MPLYEYKCQKCGENVEAIQRIADPPYTICPQCGGELKKLFSAPAIQFKGSGFHITDYPRAGSKSESKEGSDTKSESKPAKTESSSKDKPTESSSKDKPKEKKSE